MTGERPKFMDSPYFVAEPGNWHLKPGAPQEIKDEFEAEMQLTRQMERPKQLPPVEKVE